MALISALQHQCIPKIIESVVNQDPGEFLTDYCYFTRTSPFFSQIETNVGKTDKKLHKIKRSIVFLPKIDE